jgi:hypothetical protein
MDRDATGKWQITIPRFPESPRNENQRGIGIPSHGQDSQSTTLKSPFQPKNNKLSIKTPFFQNVILNLKQIKNTTCNYCRFDFCILITYLHTLGSSIKQV